jgi:hypothetical protein
MGFQEETRVLDPLSHLDESLYSLLFLLVLVSNPKAPIEANEYPKETIVVMHLFTDLPGFHVGLLHFGNCLTLVRGVREGEENVQVQFTPYPFWGGR